MKVDLEREDIEGIIYFLGETPIVGKQARTLLIYQAKLAAALEANIVAPSPPQGTEASKKTTKRR